jgi:hypothetical protein
LDADERAYWRTIGRSVLPLRTCSAAELPMALMLAQELARRDRMRRDSGTTATALNAVLLAIKQMWTELGVGASGRNKSCPLPLDERDEADPLDEFGAQPDEGAH